ncbi:hypothetical protein Tsubulata_045817, partial [Turnera subulata]
GFFPSAERKKHYLQHTLLNPLLLPDHQPNQTLTNKHILSLVTTNFFKIKPYPKKKKSFLFLKNALFFSHSPPPYTTRNATFTQPNKNPSLPYIILHFLHLHPSRSLYIYIYSSSVSVLYPSLSLSLSKT